MRRKLLALFLVLCLVLPLIPAVTLDVASAETTKTYRLVTSVEELQDGCIYLLVNTDEAGVGKALSKQNTINRSAVDVTITTDRAIVLTEDQIAFYNNEDKVFQLTLGGSTGEWSFYIKSAGYLFNPPSNNQLKTQGTNNDNSKFTISFENTDVNIISSSGRYLCYDEDSNVYSCYAEDDIGDKDSFLCLYRYDADAGIDDPPVTPSPTAEPTATPEPSPTAEPNDSKTYVLVTEEKELASGSTYLIASSGESGEAYVMSKQDANTRSAYEVTVSDDSTIVLNTSEIASSNNDSTAFELKLEGSTDAWALFDPINGYLYSTDNDDYLKSSPEQTCTFTIRYNSGSVAAMISSMNGTKHDDLQFNDNNKVFSCYERGKQPVYLYKLVDGTEPPADKPEIESWSVVLSGQIGMNFYMTIPKGYQPDTMKITIGSREVTAKGVKQDDGRYKFTCYLTSVEMAEQITAVYTYEVDGTEARESKTTSIQGYLNEIIVNIDHKEEYEKAKALAKALLNYGYYAQKAVADGVNHPETDETYIGEANLPTEITGYVTEPTLDSSIITGVTYSLSLDTETALNIYLTTADGCVLSKDNVVISATGAYVEYSVDKVGSRYRVKITGIGAHELGTVITVTIGNSTIQASALTYVQKCLVNDKVKQATKNAAAALYRYYQEAIIYAGGAEG